VNVLAHAVEDVLPVDPVLLPYRPVELNPKNIKICRLTGNPPKEDTKDSSWRSGVTYLSLVIGQTLPTTGCLMSFHDHMAHFFLG
jgi:hypothetical protein